MQPRERRETGEQDLFRSRLDQIIDLKHPLVALGRRVDWEFLEREFGAVYSDDPGRPPLPTRLMAGLAILKHTYDLSDEVLCERRVENPYYPFFCGEASSAGVRPLVADALAQPHGRGTAAGIAAGEPVGRHQDRGDQGVRAVTGDRRHHGSTQERDVPTDAKLLNRAREKLVRLARRHGVGLRQSYARVGKLALIQHQRYAHAKQFKRANRMLKKLRTYLGRVIRRHRPQDRGQQRARSDVRKAAVADAARARAETASAWAEGLFPACAGSRMHRQRQSPSALRVRRQGQRCHHPQALQGRPVRHPREGAAWQSI
jgi:IS5 family transposase